MSKIPGLPDSEWEKVLKSKNKKESVKPKKVSEVKKPRKKKEKKSPAKSLSKVALVPSVTSNEEPERLTPEMSQFTFSDHSSEDENFEDSKEEFIDSEGVVDPMTPAPAFKSYFALTYERSMSSPDLRPDIKSTRSVPDPTIRTTSKRNLSSPDDQASPKKTKPSKIPALNRKQEKED